ncbi:MAG: heavy-metal-associated domain-containing protein [Anaerolineales bacterium]|nr:heavy-metal-associated domain-containing protein [Anaerolineales bacterium]
MENKTYHVPSIHCNHCVHTIKMELSELEGVSNVDASAETKDVVVSFTAPASDASIRNQLKEIGYPSE